MYGYNLLGSCFVKVYRGRTKCGEDVAVKVQRRNLQFNVARDVYILRIGVNT